MGRNVFGREFGGWFACVVLGMLYRVGCSERTALQDTRRMVSVWQVWE